MAANVVRSGGLRQFHLLPTVCLDARVASGDAPTSKLCGCDKTLQPVEAHKLLSLVFFEGVCTSHTQDARHHQQSSAELYVRYGTYSTVWSRAASRLRRKRGLGPVAKIIHAALGTIMFGLILVPSGHHPSEADRAGFHPRHCDDTTADDTC